MNHLLLFLLNNSIHIMAILFFLFLLFQFFNQFFMIKNTDKIDLIARWCFIERMRVKKMVFYIEYKDHSNNEE
jgi:hypothetical protein